MNDCKFYGKICSEPRLKETNLGHSLMLSIITVSKLRGTQKLVTGFCYNEMAIAIANNFKRNDMIFLTGTFQTKHKLIDGKKEYYGFLMFNDFFSVNLLDFDNALKEIEEKNTVNGGEI